ncbi:haloacid dehalogenase-like hydrolase (HAD) superfamily protein isoform X3 [Tasmannia lanceolata]
MATLLGAAELCGFLDSRKIRRGLITRNVKSAVDMFHLRFGLEFSPALSREFRPYKPDPAPLLHIISTWGVQPDEVMMIGDSLKDDVACGKRAGAFTCLLDEKGRYDSPDYFNADLKPDFKVSSLVEVYSLLEANFELMQ